MQYYEDADAMELRWTMADWNDMDKYYTILSQELTVVAADPSQQMTIASPFILFGRRPWRSGNVDATRFSG